jgi:eukaryotic-like serine/threonine-protein kinase
MECAVCHADMPDHSGDQVCARCALTRALAQPSGEQLAAGPSTIQGYELLHELGRGAMGVVWLARERALDRLVALKVIAGADDPLLAQRLLREGQAVARLSHPNIVAIHALGGSGAETFLAMEFAEGGNLAARVDGKPLDPHGAAQLVAKLARAVAHAHAAGIVHRDLKPSNVLLSAGGEPQLADFGLAGPLEGRGELTRSGQVVGTPAYLAPELLENSAAASPAADVYGLGAVLYFCLTARAPFAGDSTAALLHQVSAADPVSPRLLQPGVPRDLETICLKCLGKSPAGRYASAEALHEDLERFLRHEPIAARPIGSWGKALRWSRRHPNKAAALALAAAVVSLLAIGGPLVALRLDRERRAASQSAAESAAISQFLQTDLLSQASPRHEQNRDLKLRTALDRAAAGMDERFSGEPAIRAALHETLGATYLVLGEYPTAHANLARAYALQRERAGPDDPMTLRIRSRLAELFLWEAKYALMEQTARDTWERQKRILGPEHPDTLYTQNILAESLRYLGRFREDEALLVPLVMIRRRVSGPENWETLSASTDLVYALSELGKLREAEVLARQTLEILRRKFGPDNLMTLRVMNALMIIYSREGKLEESVALGREAVERFVRVMGPEHAETMAMYNNLATALTFEGRFEEALVYLNRSLAAHQKVSDPNDPETLVVINNLATTLRSLGRFAEAETYALQAVAGFQRVFGPEHPRPLNAQFGLATLYKYSGRLPEAEALDRKVLTGRQRVLGAAHSDTLWTETDLGDVLLREGRFTDAEGPLRDTLALAAKTQWDEWKRALTRSRLGEALLAQGKRAEAEPLLRESEKVLDANRERMIVSLRFEVEKAHTRVARLPANP